MKTSTRLSPLAPVHASHENARGEKHTTVSLMRFHNVSSYVSRKLAQIPVRLTAPARLSCADMIISMFPNVTLSTVQALRSELREDHEFTGRVNREMFQKRRRQVTWTDWREFLYVAVRLSRPQTAFETGVFDGVSSAIILLALSRNGQGSLVSIDLPATETIEGSTNFMPETTLPPGSQPGWLVPDYLRDRYRLVLGDSKALLPDLLAQYQKIDLFFHDSLHTFEHQYFEYTQAWPHLSDGGLLLSDDIFWNPAFYRFCKEQRRRYVRLEGFGAVRK